MPKFTTDEITAEINALEHTEARAAAHYLQLEIKRRKRSAFNRGRPVTNDTEKHKKWREASERYRNK